MERSQSPRAGDREGKGPLDSLPTPSVVEGSPGDPVPLKMHSPNHDTNQQESASRQKFVVNGREERPASPERTEHSSRCFYSGKGCGQSPGRTATAERGETQDLTFVQTMDKAEGSLDQGLENRFCKGVTDPMVSVGSVSSAAVTHEQPLVRPNKQACSSNTLFMETGQSPS